MSKALPEWLVRGCPQIVRQLRLGKAFQPFVLRSRASSACLWARLRSRSLVRPRSEKPSHSLVMTHYLRTAPSAASRALHVFFGFGHVCRYIPSCSEYMAVSLRERGLWRGGWAGTRRLLRCHPFSRRAVWDPPEWSA